MKIYNKLQVLRYCYTLKATLTEDNMLGILYGADIYILPNLFAESVFYIGRHIKQANSMKVFNVTHLMDCLRINEECVKHFQEDPVKCFRDDTFRNLSLPALKRLAGLPQMNCTGYDMKSAVIDWFVANGHCESKKDMDDEKLWRQGFAEDDFGVKVSHSLVRDGSHIMDVREFKTNTTQIKFCSSSEERLLGIGLCTGIVRQDDELVKLTIMKKNMVIYSYERSVMQPQCFAIVEVMFEEVVTVTGPVSIKVEFNSKKPRTVITESISFCPPDIDGDRFYHICTEMVPADKNEKFTCLAYLILKSKR
jgi:hypothetical protein